MSSKGSEGGTAVSLAVASIAAAVAGGIVVNKMWNNNKKSNERYVHVV